MKYTYIIPIAECIDDVTYSWVLLKSYHKTLYKSYSKYGNHWADTVDEWKVEIKTINYENGMYANVKHYNISTKKYNI